MTVVVRDTVPPAITVAATPHPLAAANKMVDVTLR